MPININLTNVAQANPTTNYTTPLDADKVGIWDNANSLFKGVTWANIKSTLKTYFDGIYKATFAENTAFNKNFGTTAGTVLEGNAPRYMTIHFSAGTLSPADSTTYYIGRTLVAISPSTTASNNTFQCGVAGTIVRIHFDVGQNTVSGSAENSVIKIRNETTATSSASFGNITTDATSTSQNSFELSGTTAIVAANDNICVQMDTPAWATNPTTIRMNGWILIKLT